MSLPYGLSRFGISVALAAFSAFFAVISRRIHPVVAAAYAAIAIVNALNAIRYAVKP